MFDELAAIPAERERMPVRRSSRAAGRCEGVFWRKTTRQEMRQIVVAAKRYELAGKAAGSRNGPLGGVALEVLEYLANLIDYRTGRLEPSIDTLKAKLKRSRDAIVRALKALQCHGFLDWLRRYVPTGNEGRGPQVIQTSNAYRLSLPERAKRLLGRFGVRSPTPDDFAHVRAAQTAQREAYAASLPKLERIALEVDHPDLAASLQRLWQSMEARKLRESAKRTESQPSFLSKRI